MGRGRRPRFQPDQARLGKLKARGAKIVAINPVRSGYGAIADEWIGIRPGTDGLFAFALIHELLEADRIDLDYLVRYANAHWLVIDHPGGADDGLFARDADGNALCAIALPFPGRGGWEGLVEQETQPTPTLPFCRRGGVRFVDANAIDISPAVVGEYVLPDGRKARPVFQLIVERYLDPQYSPDAVSERCGIPADTIRRIARELAEAAFDSKLELPIAWTDSWGREHATMEGRPVSMHAMRGISAHSNGFHTCRALHLLQLLLGAVDAPGSFRYQPPFPKPIPPANRPGKARKPDGVLDAAPLGFVHGPEDLVVDEAGQPRRIDHAYSWAYPLSAHGMMHTVIRNVGPAIPTGSTPADVHGQHELELGDEHRRDHALAHRQGRSRRIQDPAHHLFRCLCVGDGRVCRPGVAGHDLPRTLRRDQPAGPPDQRRRRRQRRDPPSGVRS